MSTIYYALRSNEAILAVKCNICKVYCSFALTSICDTMAYWTERKKSIMCPKCAANNPDKIYRTLSNVADMPIDRSHVSTKVNKTYANDTDNKTRYGKYFCDSLIEYQELELGMKTHITCSCDWIPGLNNETKIKEYALQNNIIFEIDIFPFGMTDIFGQSVTELDISMLDLDFCRIIISNLFYYDNKGDFIDNNLTIAYEDKVFECEIDYMSIAMSNTKGLDSEFTLKALRSRFEIEKLNNIKYYVATQRHDNKKRISINIKIYGILLHEYENGVEILIGAEHKK